MLLSGSLALAQSANSISIQSLLQRIIDLQTQIITFLTNQDDCNEVDQATFTSAQNYPVGMGPNGPVLGNWSIMFNNGEFSWHYGDVIEKGTYTCLKNSLAMKIGSSSTKAHYYPQTATLIWDTIEYTKVEN